MENKPAVQIDTIRLGENNQIDPNIQKAINDSISISYSKAENKQEPKTITYTEKDFKEMVNGWNEERERLQDENEDFKRKIEVRGNKIVELAGENNTLYIKNITFTEIIDELKFENKKLRLKIKELEGK
jgi:hypothetical protein